MTYVISNIHGYYEKFKAMLDKINFSDSDTLYVLGDTIDIGNDSLSVLSFMKEHPNIIPIAGNHEYHCYKCMNMLVPDMNSDSQISNSHLDSFRNWLEIGGISMMDELRNISDAEKNDIMEYLSSFKPYVTVEVGDKKFILVHSGLDNFAQDKKPDDYSIEELLFSTPDYERVYFKNIYLVTAHARVCDICNTDRNTIFIKNNHIAINCRTDCDDRLACLRLEDFCEFYI